MSGETVQMSRAEFQAMIDEAAEKAAAKHVEHRIAAAVVEMAKGPSSTTIGEIIERHAAEQCDPRAPQRPDHKICRQHVRLHLDLVFEYGGRPMSFRDMPLSETRPEMLEEWKKQLLVTPLLGRWGFVGPLCPACSRVPGVHCVGPGRPCYSPSTANRAVGSFQTAVTWFAGHRRHNPFKGIAREDVEDEGRKGFMTHEQELDGFLRYCRPLLADMWRLAVNAGGMRKTELRLLVVSEVDWLQKTITFPKGNRTKNRKGRTFSVRDEELTILRRYRAEVEQRDPCDDRDCPMIKILRADKKNPTHWHLFADPSSAAASPVSEGTLTDWQQEAAAKWGQLLSGEVVTLHHARHTFACWSIAKGIPTSAIMREGGWKTLKTFQHYEKSSQALIESCRRSRGRSMVEILAFAAEQDARNAKKEAA